MNPDNLAELFPPQTLREEIDATMQPWHQDPIRLARLWRFLIIIGRPLPNPATFMEHAEKWQGEYDAMEEFRNELNLDGAA